MNIADLFRDVLLDISDEFTEKRDGYTGFSSVRAWMRGAAWVILPNFLGMFLGLFMTLALNGSFWPPIIICTIGPGFLYNYFIRKSTVLCALLRSVLISAGLFIFIAVSVNLK